MGITQERVRELFDYREDGILIRKSNGLETAQYNSRDGYKRVSFDGERLLTHRVIFLMHHGFLPKVVDHMNRDRSDNRIENLRECGLSMNVFNRVDSSNKSGKKGVFLRPDTGKYQSYIYHNGKKKNLGCFDEIESATMARREAELKYFGEYSPA